MKLILCGADMPQFYRKKLENYADRVACMPEYPEIKGSTSTHPDMLGYAAGNRLFIARDFYLRRRAFFDSLGCEIVPCKVAYGEYPRDVYFNVFAVGGTLFGRTDMTPPEITGIYNKCIIIKQGYAKCSTLLLCAAGVTADKGIADALAGNGSDALLIPPGGVSLRGYGYGFIGGACVTPDGATLLPAGDLDTHPDAGRIRAFAADHGFKTDNGIPGDPLLDCGGILILEI